MSNYIVKVENTSGVAGTIISDRAFSYTENLNELNQGKLRITGTGETKRELFEIGSKVYFYRDGQMEFMGLINNLSYLDAGGIAADLQGYETWLIKENGAYANSPWKSTASQTIATSIIGESTYFTAGTINTGIDIDLKVESSSNIYNGLLSLTKNTGQDIGIDYTNLEVDILDHKGSSTSVATLNDNLQINDLTVRKSYPIGNDIRVFGKGDGENQIKSNTSTSGQNQDSKDIYGTIQKDYIDSSVISQTQADNLANKLVAQWKDPVSVYEFDVINPSLNVVCGDVVTLNAKTKGLNNEEVRVVGIKRGFRDQEFLTLQVTNKEYSAKQRSIEKYISELQKGNNENQTYMQGTTNVLTFSEMINANSSAPLRVKAYLPSSFITDEAGNLRVNSFTLDYDIDPFRSTAGNATEDNISPTVTGTSDEEDALVEGTSDDEDASVNGDSGEWEEGTDTGTDYDSSTSVGALWANMCSVNIPLSANNQDIYADVAISVNSGGPEDTQITCYMGDSSSTHIDSKGFWIPLENFDSTFLLSGILVGNPADSDEYVRVDARSTSGVISLECGLRTYVNAHTHDDGDYYAIDHDHADGSYYAVNHDHADGSYAAESHNHNVAIGDVVSDAGSLNATGVNIYVDHWNGSAWVNKHSVLTTGKTLDTDVDVSDGGTYPDAAGYWRVRIFTNNSTADLINGILKVKHEMDT